MQFVQIIEYRTEKVDEMRKLGAEYDDRLAESKARRVYICQDRDQPGRYFNIVFFDSYEDAMENSESPVTQEFAGKMAALAEGAPSFYNLNLVDERGGGD